MNKFFQFVKTHFDTFDRQYLPSMKNNIYCQTFQEHRINVVPDRINFLSPRLQQKINQNIYWQTRYIFEAYNQLVTLDVFALSRNSKQHNNILYVVLFMIHYCSMVNKSNIRQTVNVRVILSKYRKALTKNKYIDEYNVNSGVTSIHRYSDIVDVLIFRREEVAKVLIHELLHAMGLDDKQHVNMSNSVSEYFGSQSHLNINESFTETYASMLNLGLASLVSKRGISHFKDLVANEKVFLRHQATKILHHSRFTVENGHLKYPQKYSESTNIISYYVLKYINFKNIDAFCMFLHNNQFHLNELNDYIQFLENNINQHKWAKFNDSNDTSLRMSCIDLIDILSNHNKAYKTVCR